MNIPKIRTVHSKKVLECGVCGNHFSVEGKKLPRLLFCGHSFCHECLTKLQIQDGEILCPMDRQPTPVNSEGVCGLKKNFALVELLEKIELTESSYEISFGTIEAKKSNSECVACDENENHRASVYCVVCCTNLCHDCSQLTHTTKTLSKHRLVSLKDKPSRIAMCSLHQTYALEFVCLEELCTASPVLCFLCKEHGKHKGHKTELLDTEAAKLRTSTHDAVESAQVFLTRVSGHACKIVADIQRIEGGTRFSANQNGALSRHNEQGTAESARACIHEYFTQLRNDLARQEKVALTTLDSHVRGALSNLRSSHDKVSTLQTQVAAAILHCHRLLSKSNQELVGVRSEILAMNGLLSQQERSFDALCGEKTDATVPVTFTKDNRVHIGPKLEIRVVTLGLDGAGKTTLLFKLKQNEFMQHIPTMGFNVETIDFHNLRFTVWDVGGDEKLRPLWKHYHLNTQAIMFVVDASDAARFDEARIELGKLIGEKNLREAVLLVLANKQDLPGAVPSEELSKTLNLHKLCCGRTWKSVDCDARTGVGLEEGLKWLSRQLVAARVLEIE